MKYIEYLEKNPLNLEGKTILITGANSGLGFEFARLSLYYKMNLILACRSLEKATRARQRLIEEFEGANVDIMLLDQIKKDSIRTFSNELKTRHIDYFVFNAGAYVMSDFYRSDEDYNYVIATNFFGPARLMKELKNYFKVNTTTLIFVNSVVRSMVKIKNGIEVDIKRKKNNHRSYELSKHYLMDYCVDLAKHNPTLKIINVAPGITGTNILKQQGSRIANSYKKVGTAFMNTVGNKPEKSALILVEALKEERQSLDYVVPGLLFHLKGYPKVIKTPFSGVLHQDKLNKLI